jgi:hypothetical protein
MRAITKDKQLQVRTVVDDRNQSLVVEVVAMKFQGA